MNSFLRGLLFKRDLLYAPLRRFAPVLTLPFGRRPVVLVSRYDDVREVLGDHSRFGVPYREKIEVIMGGANMFLGMDREPERGMAKALMYEIAPPAEAETLLAPEAELAAERLVEQSGGRMDVANGLIQRVTVDVLGRYFGLPGHDDWQSYAEAAKLLFRFQFIDQKNDPELRKQAEEIAAILRRYVQGEIGRRRKAGCSRGPDDLLGRCLAHQRRDPPFTDETIRSNLIGFIVGGFPQPPMVGAQLMDELLRRPTVLAQAREAALGDDDGELGRIVFEALRFQPLTPGLEREALGDTQIAFGQRHQRKIAGNSKIFVLMRSAMHDPRALDKPHRFRPVRDWRWGMHFGHGAHQCFGVHINQVLLPALLKPLLKRRLRRAPGRAGRLTMNGPYPEDLVVAYD